MLEINHQGQTRAVKDIVGEEAVVSNRGKPAI